MRAAIDAAGQRLRSAAVDGLEWLWPIDCMLCGREADESFQPASRLCWDCRKRLPWMEAVFCPRCLAPYALGSEEEGCRSCKESPPSWEVGHASFRYADPVRGWIHDYKYRRKYDMRRPLAHLFLSKRPPWFIAGDWDAMVAMPIHPRRLLGRGFDHIHLLAKTVAPTLGVELLPGALRRKRYARPQVGLEGSQRAANVAGSIEATPSTREALDEKRILLIDDVVTTGASLREAGSALLNAGAARVGIWTLASAVGRSDADRRDDR